MAVISPWLVRNRVVLGHWLFIRDNFPFELSLGNFPYSNGMGWGGRHPALNPQGMNEYIRLGEVAFISHYGALARQFIRDHPGEFLGLCGKRFIVFWNGESMMYGALALEWWRPWMFWPLSLLAFAGGVFAISRRVPGAWMYALGILLYPLPYYLTYPQIRYRHAIEPLMLLFSVYLLGQLWNDARRKQNPA